MKALALLLSVVVAKDRVLVIHDDTNVEKTYSGFLGNLLKTGFDLDLKKADAEDLKLVEYGVNKYEHVFLIAPNTDEFGGDLSVVKISEYVDNGGNMIIGLDEKITDTLRAVASEFGVVADTEGQVVIDHFNFDRENDDGTNTLINIDVGKQYSKAKPFQPRKAVKSIKYQGVGMTVNKKNDLVMSVMNAADTSYSYATGKTNIIASPAMIGREISLITALEARNNARVLIVGSLKFFSDEFFTTNEPVTKQLSQWAFKRTGMLRLSNPEHFLTNTGQTLETYTIFDEMTFQVDIEQKNQDTGKWEPAKNDDIQVEWTRIDPFVRQFLKKGKGAKQTTQFKLPDVYGVYKFIVNYKREGYTYIHEEITVPVRPLQHTQYERFIVSAYPYYAGAGSMLAGLFMFSFVFLYHK